MTFFGQCGRRMLMLAGGLIAGGMLGGCGGGSGKPTRVSSAVSTAAVALPLTSQQTVSLMPLGDSLTAGYSPNGDTPGGYRAELWERLHDAGIDARFVGSQSSGPDNLPQKSHEGHSGFRIDQIAASVDGWLKTSHPQVVLLLIGTNDIIQSDGLSSAPARLRSLIERIADDDPQADILVGTLPPLADPSEQRAADAYNAAIPGIVQFETLTGRRVRAVGLSQAYTAPDLADGIHPDAAGYAKLGDAWYNALHQ